MTTVPSHDDAFKMLRELLDYDPDEGDRRMTEWELNFIERLESMPRPGLSPAQRSKIAEIWQRIFG